MAGKGENVKVAVRVRPFSKNEIAAKSKCVVQMKDNVVQIVGKDGRQLPFTFDFCYWSHDGFTIQPDGYVAPDPSHPNGAKYADQKRVYSEMGLEAEKNAFEGFNCAIFAYGQTGAGKSYSVIGDKKNQGIVPSICSGLFKRISEKKDDKDGSTVVITMLEIYNEEIRDLLNNSKVCKCRENPGQGFFAEGLTKFPVKNYQEAEKVMDEGNVARTIHATNMNETSSRAHTVISITFTQKCNTGGIDMVKTATISLVDLAGSERVSKTLATGSRLKEGAGINQSLTNLGLCIHALATESNQVPFRNSSLTKILANSLNGNCKTMMMAAISPAEGNRDESISTLNYANSAKRMKTKPIVNESEVEKALKALSLENEKLKQQLASGPNTLATGNISQEKLDEMKKQHDEQMQAVLAENQIKMESLKSTYEEKLILAQKGRKNSVTCGINFDKINEERKTKPHLTNLNSDGQLTGRIVYILKKGNNEIGTQKNLKADIQLMGSSIFSEHAKICWTEKDELFMELSNPEAKVLHNGNAVTAKVVLHHNDRILFGPTALFIFIHPKERNESKIPYPLVDFPMAQAEIARTCGMILPTSEDSQNFESVHLQEEMLSIMPAVQEANCISGELDKRVKFKIVIVPVNDPCHPEIVKSEIHVQMENLENGQHYVWDKNKFLCRLALMKNIYANYEEQDICDLSQYEDPFAESPDCEVEIGHCNIFTQPLSYLLECKDEYDINNYDDKEVGKISVEIDPCTPDGVEFQPSDNKFVEKPEELLGRDLHFLLRIHWVKNLPNRYMSIQCRYKFYEDEEETVTGTFDDPSHAKINHSRVCNVKSAGKEFVKSLHDGVLVISVFGKQQPRKSAMAFSRGKTTHELLKGDRNILVKNNCLMGAFNMNGRVIDPYKQSCVVELLLCKKQMTRLQQRLDGCRKMVDKAQRLGCKGVPVYMVRDVLNAHNGTVVDKILGQLEGPMDDDDHYKNNNKVHASSSCNIL